MFLFFLLISFFSFKVEGGELIIVQSPSSVKFEGDEPIDQHLISEIFSTAVGFTTQQESNWSGMSITDPFNFAEALVILYVDGVPTLGKVSGFSKYKVNSNEDEFITWRTIRNRINDRYPLENNTLIKIELSHSEEGTDGVKAKHLSKNIAEDADFLKEINNLNKVMKIEKKYDGVPDLYWFSMKSLHPLLDLKGSHHVSTIEAKEMVHEALLKLAKEFGKAYHQQAMIVALLSDASHTRKARSVATERTDSVNVTDDIKDNIYDPDFPVIFNIIIWFTVTLFFSLLAVSIFIAAMDPGRDSIIYRMTSNRMKKDS